jgi:RsiW-degrading membrane proteinase PrsW (M82 family)
MYFMKQKVQVFLRSLIIYMIIFLIWHHWNLTTKQIAEMFFIGIFSSLVLALMINRMTRLVTRIVEKLVGK